MQACLFLVHTQRMYDSNFADQPLLLRCKEIGTLLFSSGSRLLQNIKTSVCSILNSSWTDVFIFCNKWLSEENKRVPISHLDGKFYVILCVICGLCVSDCLFCLSWTTCAQNTSVEKWAYNNCFQDFAYFICKIFWTTHHKRKSENLLKFHLRCCLMIQKCHKTFISKFYCQYRQNRRGILSPPL